jgi:hypothetical protein
LTRPARRDRLAGTTGDDGVERFKKHAKRTGKERKTGKYNSLKGAIGRGLKFSDFGESQATSSSYRRQKIRLPSINRVERDVTTEVQETTRDMKLSAA